MVATLLPELKTRVGAAAIRAARPVTYPQTAAIPPAHLRTTMTAAAAAAATTTTAHLLPPLRRRHPQRAQTPKVAAIQIRDLQRKRRKRNEDEMVVIL